MKSIQQNIKRNTKDFSEFGLWVGGLDVSTKNIDQFDPLRAGYSRIFIVPSSTIHGTYGYCGR